MTVIVKYGEQFDEALRSLDESTFFEVKYHGDVLRDEVYAAVSDGAFAGICYLRSTPSFALLSKKLPRYFLTAVFLAIPGSAEEVEVSLRMLSWIQERYEALQRKYPRKRIILRLWCKASDHAYAELLLSTGFRAMEIMPVMIRPLTDTDLLLFTEKETQSAGPVGESSNTGKSFEETSEVLKPEERLSDSALEERMAAMSSKMLPAGLRFSEPEFTEAFSKEYLRQNGRCFGIPDSEAELRFILSGGGRLFTVMDGNRLVSAVTTWRIDEHRAATENIFCAPEYREKGITTALLKTVFSELRKEGFGEVSLSLFGDNQPAFRLYEKLGYEVSEMLLEMHYETDYEMREY